LDYRARGRGVHADRRRAARVRADGRAGGRGAERHDAAVDRARAFRRIRARAGVARAYARVLLRLADELLDHDARGARLWRQPDCAEVGAGAWGAGRQSRGDVASAWVRRFIERSDAPAFP